MARKRPGKTIDGRAIAQEIHAEVSKEVGRLFDRGLVPGLAVVLVGENPASQVYVRSKRRTCDELGIRSFAHDLPSNTPERKLLRLIRKLNRDPLVHGILVQMPLPPQIDDKKVLNAIDPNKDVDGFHPVNVGLMLNGEESFVPCTPAGCIEMLLRSNIDPAGKHAVIIGRSNIVGKPLAALLMQKRDGGNATVTVCHSRSKKLPEITSQADILFAAIGTPNFVKENMVKENAVVIDVGINRVPDKTKQSGSRLVGDVDFDAVRPKVRAITPVPGGVGPMTIAMLMRNTVQAAQYAMED